jgi:glycine/D-amino acid oxidase-like deaminating enzyme
VTVAGRLTIIGGGVMGLMAAYYAAPLADGTGYKFAPWVGRVLAQLAVQRGTVYDIGRFTPARFAGGAPVTGAAS